MSAGESSPGLTCVITKNSQPSFYEAVIKVKNESTQTITQPKLVVQAGPTDAFLRAQSGLAVAQGSLVTLTQFGSIGAGQTQEIRITFNFTGSPGTPVCVLFGKGGSSSSSSSSSSSGSGNSSSSSSSSSGRASSSSSSSGLTSSSSSSSSSSSTGSSSGGVIDAAALMDGKVRYDDQCAACHGATGGGLSGLFPAINPQKIQFIHSEKPSEILGLEDFIDKYMGKAQDPNTCNRTDSCVQHIAAYIRNGFSTAPAMGNPVSEAEAKRRTDQGQIFYTSKSCVICHGNDGLRTQNGKTLFNCEACTSWNTLYDLISRTMPPESGGGFGPQSCEDECVARTTDWIWKQVNGWTLTENGGTRPTAIDNKLGFETLRLKSYKTISADYVRVFGAVPLTLKNAATSFTSTPLNWFAAQDLGAVTLNVLINAAVESCTTQTMPAFTAPAVEAQCKKWAETMWLRAPTAEELDNCVDTALVSSTGIGTEKQRLIMTCASMMTAAPALIF